MADLPSPIDAGTPAGATGLAAAAGLRTGDARSPEQLRALAAQFESLLMGQLLRGMQQSMFEADDDSGTTMGTGPLGDALFAELSIALSRAGGIGLTNSLIGPLAAQAGVASPTTSSTVVPGASETIAPGGETTGFAAMPGRLSSGYGWRRDPIDGQMRFHRGLDLAVAIGEDVPSARAGQVQFAGELPGYGLTVVVKHDDRLSTRYAHLSEVLVKPGDEVAGGATIARSGSTGRATGPHLHVEVLEHGRAVAPDGIRPRSR